MTFRRNDHLKAAPSHCALLPPCHHKLLDHEPRLAPTLFVPFAADATVKLEKRQPESLRDKTTYLLPQDLLAAAIFSSACGIRRGATMDVERKGGAASTDINTWGLGPLLRMAVRVLLFFLSHTFCGAKNPLILIPCWLYL
jgi:hypothetical protein